MKVSNTLRVIGKLLFVVWVILVIAFVVFTVLYGFFALNQSPQSPFFTPMVVILVGGTFIGGPISFFFGLIKFISDIGWKIVRHKAFILLGMAIIAVGFFALGITLALPLFYPPPELSVIFTVLAIDLIAIGVGLLIALWLIRDTGFNKRTISYSLTLFASGPLAIGLLLGLAGAGFSRM
jgi:hypothetical protein